MHFTIFRQKADQDPRHNTYVVGHDLGGGWTRHLVQLEGGDTADNPASTKGPIYGPKFICYDVARSGITTVLYDSPGDFYDDVYRNRVARDELMARRSA